MTIPPNLADDALVAAISAYDNGEPLNVVSRAALRLAAAKIVATAEAGCKPAVRRLMDAESAHGPGEEELVDAIADYDGGRAPLAVVKGAALRLAAEQLGDDPTCAVATILLQQLADEESSAPS